LGNWIGTHLAKCAVERDVKTACQIVKTENNNWQSQINGAEMSIKMF
jgi:hypothetical protein